jgi:hypothetical protein
MPKTNAGSYYRGKPEKGKYPCCERFQSRIPLFRPKISPLPIGKGRAFSKTISLAKRLLRTPQLRPSIHFHQQ